MINSQCSACPSGPPDVLNSQSARCMPKKKTAMLLPLGGDRSHHQITNELVAGINGEEFHALFHEQRARQLYGGDKAKPHVKAHHQTEMQVFRAKPVKKQSQGESRNQACYKRAGKRWPGALLHLLSLGFVIRVVTHLAHPGFREEQRRVPQKS